jgi:hypothetical protein
MSDAHARFGKRPASLAPAVMAEVERQAELVRASAGAQAGPQWGLMHKVLLRAKVDPTVIMRLVAARDADGLADLVRWLRGEEVAEAVVEEPTGPQVDPDVMRAAMKVFRKRLRLARLDAESRLGVGPLSGGKRSEIDAIEAPREHPTAVWHALVRAGRLRTDGKGFYSLAVDDLGDE